MELQDLHYSPLEETLQCFLSDNDSEAASSAWSYEENKLFEDALAEIYPDSPDFFDNVASRIPWKTIQEIESHYQALVDDLKTIEAGEFPIPDYNDNEQPEEEEEEDEEMMAAANDEGSQSNEAKMRNGRQRRRGVPWTEEEHQLFLMGLNKYGKGDWRSISRYYVLTKTPTQVASHAQKYFRRQSSSTPVERRRPSIHDIQTVRPTTASKIHVVDEVFTFSSCGLDVDPTVHNNFDAIENNVYYQRDDTILPNFRPSRIRPVFEQTSAGYHESYYYLFPSMKNQY